MRVPRPGNARRLDTGAGIRIFWPVNRNLVFPILLMVVFAMSRWPGLLPENFSAAYAIAFCAGLFFPGRSAFWLPLGTLLLTDLALNCYYQFSLGIDCFTLPTLLYLGGNYVGYVLLIVLGKGMGSGKSFARLLSAGLFGALLFYLVTNTLSWLLNPFGNPEYTKNLTGWIWALTKGTGGWPETWTFLRNTLLSGGLFTGLFVAAMKISASAESKQEKEAGEPTQAEDQADEAEPAPAK